MITIENKFLSASFLTKGAEWRSLVEKASGREYLWQADAKFWGKSAPVLFPIVGSLKDGQYEYEGKKYSLGRHGFARDREFTVKTKEDSRVVFALESDEESKKVYPFDWSLEIEFKLDNRSLHTSYRVANKGSELWFSIGAHPAFNLPFFGQGTFEEGYVEFEGADKVERHMLDAQGLVSGETRVLPTQGRQLPATRPLFADDALVLKKLKGTRIALRQKGNKGAVVMDAPDFPFFGIWGAPGAPFVCLEPWCGVTDAVTASGKLQDKEGINHLGSGGVFIRSFVVTVEG